MKELTTYQIYLILLGCLAERSAKEYDNDGTEMLKTMLTELYRRAEGKA